jgi:hypothetical protein
MKEPVHLRRPLPNPAKPEPNRSSSPRRDAEAQRPAQSSCHDGVVVEWDGKPEEAESELRSNRQAEARPTKEVRASLGCTRQVLTVAARKAHQSRDRKGAVTAGGTGHF